MVRYRSRRPTEAELREKLRDLANERRQFGYRRLFVLLRREGEPSGVNRIYRLYREEVRMRKARRRAVGTRSPILVEAKANARWSLDFVHDQFAWARHRTAADFPDFSFVAREPCFSKSLSHSRLLTVLHPATIFSLC